MKKGADEESIKNLVNINGKVNVSFTSGEMDKNHQALPEQFNFKKGVSKIYKHNDAFVVANVYNVLSSSQKTFEEAKGELTSDYQAFKEEKWLKELATKYTVKINKDVLNKIKKTLKN